MEKEINIKQLKQQQIQRLYENLALPHYLSFLGVLSLIVVQWQVIKHSVIIAWAAFAIMTYIVMFVMLFLYDKKKPKGEDILSWNTPYIIRTILYIISWSSASVLLFPVHSIMYQFFLAMVLVGICSGTVICIASSWKSISVILTAILVPLAIQFSLLDGMIYKILAILIIIYNMTCVIIAKYNNDNIDELILLRLRTNAQENELKKFEKRYEEFIENLPVGVFRCKFSDKDTFILANSSLVQMLGYNAKEELLNDSINDLFDEFSEYKLLRVSLVSNGRVDSKKIVLKKKDGNKMPCEITSRVVRNSDGKIEYFDGIILKS